MLAQAGFSGKNGIASLVVLLQNPFRFTILKEVKTCWFSVGRKMNRL